MFHLKKEEQVRQLQIDSFIANVLIVGSGGYPPTHKKAAAFEAEKRAVETRLKVEVALESSKKQ